MTNKKKVCRITAKDKIDEGVKILKELIKILAAVMVCGVFAVGVNFDKAEAAEIISPAGGKSFVLFSDKKTSQQKEYNTKKRSRYNEPPPPVPKRNPPPSRF